MLHEAAIERVCPSCYQPGYIPNAVFHYCGDKEIQCKECGKDMPRKVELPYRFLWRSGGVPHFIVRWDNRCLVIQGGHAKDATVILSRQETIKLLRQLNLSALQIPGYKPVKQGGVMEETPLVIQKVKLPYPFPQVFPEEYDLMTAQEKADLERMHYIEGWSEKDDGCLLIRDEDKFATLTREESRALLERIGMHPANIPGYKEPLKKKKKKPIIQLEEGTERVETISLLEWEQFQRWKEREKEIEETSDETLSEFKNLIDTVTSAYPEFDGDFDDLLENVRKLPRVIRYVRCGEEPPMDLDDDSLCYFDESQLMNPSWVGVKAHDRFARKKMKVTVVIEDISDGKL